MYKNDNQTLNHNLLATGGGALVEARRYKPGIASSIPDGVTFYKIFIVQCFSVFNISLTETASKVGNPPTVWVFVTLRKCNSVDSTPTFVKFCQFCLKRGQIWLILYMKICMRFCTNYESSQLPTRETTKIISFETELKFAYSVLFSIKIRILNFIFCLITHTSVFLIMP